MDQRIVEFINALRSEGVRISLAESKDAFEAVAEMGAMDRDVFRVSLRTTLIKDQRDIETFDELFPLFFQPNQPQYTNPSAEMSPEQAQQIADALRQLNDELRKALEKLMEGRPLTADELERLDQLVNMDRVDDMRLQDWKVRQMEQALQFPEVQEALRELMEMLQKMGMDRETLEKLRQMVEQNRDALRDQLKQHVGQRIMDNKLRQNRQDRIDRLYNQPFGSLSEQDLYELQKEVRRLAAVLRTRLALRLRHAKTGQLDVKSTLRANLKYGTVPLEIHHRDRVVKPKLVVLCDVSTSVRHVSELMLGFLYAIQDQISKTHAFCFIDHLEYVSPFFERGRPDESIHSVLQQMPTGHYNTDLGSALQNFQHDYMNMLDNHSTLIIVGDGRNNYNNPQLGIFQELARRARATIWLNPEPPTVWGTGDSDMLHYAPHCSRTFYVSNLAQLTEAVDQMLMHSAGLARR